MGDGRRIQRVEKSLREVISSFLLSGFHHPMPAMVSIPLVHVSPDLRNAKIYVSIFVTSSQEEGEEAEDTADSVENISAECLEILNENRHEIQRHVGRELRMKFCPKLRFYADDLHQSSLKVQNKIEELRQESAARPEDED